MSTHPSLRVLFLCTGNSARSQMAEALLRALGGEEFESFSAGTAPAGLNPLTVEVMREVGIDCSAQRSKSLDEFVGQPFDYIITVCDRARDSCPTFPGDSEKIHWSFEDPAAVEGDAQTRLNAFRRIRNEITERLRSWIAVQHKRLREAAAS